jgi:hypothetical protein
MIAATSPVLCRRFRNRSRALCTALCLFSLVGPGVEAQLTDLGAHVLTECAAPGDCLDFEAFGRALAAGDFDNDGFEDLAVGVPGEIGGGDQNAGGVHVYYGSPAGLTSLGEQLFGQDTPGIAGSSEGQDEFGSALAAGDFDLDGFADLAIGIPGEDLAAGAAVVLFGSPTGLLAFGSRSLDQGSLPPGSAQSPGSDDNFGRFLAAAASGDLTIGVPGEDPVLSGLVHRLSPSGPGQPFDSTIDIDQDDFLAACAGSNGSQSIELWGKSVFGFFGPPSLTLVVSGARESFAGGGAQAGRIFLVLDSSLACIDQNTPGMPDTSEDGDQFGAALAVGDFDADGFEDLAIGVPGETVVPAGNGRVGMVQVLFGGTGGLTVSGSEALLQANFPLGQEAGDIDDAFGESLASGDFDGDGFRDLAIGVPQEDVGAVVDAGTIHVGYGSSSGFVDAEGQTFHSNFPAGMPDSPNTVDAFGRALASGDFDGNGIDDLAVGMPGEDLGTESEAGAVTVLYGLERATDAFGTVRFGSAMTVSEVAGNRIVGLIREGGAVLPASVSHSRSGGSATPGADFNYTGGVENWTAGDLGVEVFSVQILADTLDENDETIVLQLSNPSAGLAVGSPSTLTITIEDDDEGGIVQFPGPVQVFGEGAGSAAVVVTRGSGAASGVTVQFATSNGSALAGSDYTATSGTLTFAAGETSKVIQVPLFDDGVAEPAESFLVTLANPGGGATLGTFAVVQVVILDNNLFVDGFETGNTSRWSNTIP